MTKLPHTAAVSLAALLVCGIAGAQAQSSCDTLLSRFNAAVQSRSLEEAKRAETEIAKDAVCGGSLIQVQNTRAALQLVLAEALPAGSAQKEALTVDADAPDVSWKAAAALGGMRMQQRRFKDAAQVYMRAIEVVKNPTKTPRAPDADTINQLVDAAAQARLLAANEDASGSAFVPAAADFRDGSVGGIMSEDIRGVRPVSVPLPIRFDTNAASLSPIGLEAAKELVTTLKQQNPPEVTLVGHTDAIGSDEHNMRLSDARVKTVERFLRENGVKARIRVMARGKREPLQLADKGSLTESDINALNRRVEWRRR
jgi:outer membrane protein OmpA-like peptidoglycan-associated protein